MEDVIGTESIVGTPSTLRESELEAVLHKERSRAFGIAWRLTGGNRELAEDVIQEAMVKAYLKLASLKDKRRMDSWFFQIVVREAHSQTRRRRIGRRILELFRWGHEGLQNETRSDPGLSNRIGQALGELSQGQREVFVLVHLSGFQLNEAARVLGKAEGTIKTQLHRATHRMRKKLGDIPRE